MPFTVVPWAIRKSKCTCRTPKILWCTNLKTGVAIASSARWTRLLASLTVSSLSADRSIINITHNKFKLNKSWKRVLVVLILVLKMLALVLTQLRKTVSEIATWSVCRCVTTGKCTCHSSRPRQLQKMLVNAQCERKKTGSSVNTYKNYISSQKTTI